MKDNPTGAKPTAHYPRNVHDFSARRVYTSKAGLIEAVKPIDTLPNEHIQIDVSDFLQSMPLATSAFLRGRREFAFYYVPYTQLWSNFGQYIAQRKDRYSSAMKDTKFEPRISLKKLYEWCAIAMLCDIVINHNSRHRYSVDGLTSVNESLPFGQNPEFSFTYRTVTAHKKFNNFSSQFTKVENDDIVNYNPTFGEFMNDRFGIPRWSNMIRKLDLLRYGNLVPVFSPFYDFLVDADSKPDEELGDSNIFRSHWLAFTQAFETIPDNYYVEPYRLLAYNKIYYTFFRNSFYELDYYVGDFNVDFLTCSTLESSVIPISSLSVQFLDMFQHQWKKDLFTSLMPDTQYGAVSELTFDVNNLVGDGTRIGSVANPYVRGTGIPISWKGSKNPSQPSPIDAEFSHDGNGNYQPLDIDGNPLKNDNSSNSGQLVLTVVESTSGPLGITGTGSFDVLALRRAEAIQGYRQTLLRCGNKTKDIMVGLFGVEPVWESDHDPDFIDAFGYDFAVDRVVSTAQTNESLETYDGKLGDLGGYIAKLGNTNHTIKYTTRGDYGVIMPVCYNVFESEYNSYNIDPNILALTPEDHGIPDFMNLGFVPVTRRVLSNLPPRLSLTSADLDKVLGYSTPYYEKKLDIDVVHGIFNSFNSILEDENQRYPVQYFGDFAHWVAPRSDMQSALVTTVKQFYIDPRVLNGNFLLAADGRQETDQFICNTYFKVKRTNWLSHLGLPNF